MPWKIERDSTVTFRFTVMMKGPINMAINPPVDATKTPEWAALQKHYDELQSEGISLKQWFADDAERVEKLSFDAGDLHFDLSKNLIKPETLQLFADLAKAVKLDERTKAMYTGVHINNTEDRAVLHTALRRPVEVLGNAKLAGFSLSVSAIIGLVMMTGAHFLLAAIA